MSGTNAHVILEESPAADPGALDARRRTGALAAVGQNPEGAGRPG